MIEQQHLRALRTICTCLQGLDDPWVVTGSLGMALQGMGLSVHDIDLQTGKDGAYAIGRLLSEHVVQPVRLVESKKMRSHLGLLDVDGIPVEIIGAVQRRMEDGRWEEPVRVESYLRWVEYDDLRVPVLSLEYEYEAYRAMGRPEKAELIRKWLEGSKDS